MANCQSVACYRHAAPGHDEPTVYFRALGGQQREFPLVVMIVRNSLSFYGTSSRLDSLQEMAKIMQHPQVYSFFHVPVQSGSDAILGLMKREYSRADFCHVVDFLRQRVSELWLICTQLGIVLGISFLRQCFKFSVPRFLT